MSRKRGAWLGVLLASFWLGGCATGERTEVQRLQARASYERALALTRQEPERRFFERRLAELDG